MGGYKNLAQGHRQLGGRVVARFIKDLVSRYGKKPLIDVCNNLVFLSGGTHIMNENILLSYTRY